MKASASPVLALALTALALTACRGWYAPSNAAPSASLPLHIVDLDVRGAGAPVYRIPALAVTTAGTLLAAYDARPTMAAVPSHIALVLRCVAVAMAGPRGASA